MVFAWIYIVLSVIIALFQLALALGAPWGDFTLGGRYPGKLPPRIRMAALVQIGILFLFAALVASRGGVAFEGLSGAARIGVWFVAAFFVLGTVMNLSSPSKKERIVMGPANIIALVCAVAVALGF
jgi:hypothetical protein